MTAADWSRLVLLAAIWGGAFPFMRVAAPVFGPAWTAELRVLTVTYLIPLFGLLWGWLFLGEALPASALAGGVLILAGTVMVTRG